MGLQDISTNVASIMTAIEALGYTWTDEAFSFDRIPSSNLEKHYRMTVGTTAIEEESSGRVMKTKRLDIWTAHLFIAAGDKKTAFKTILTEQDNLEDAVFNSITELPVDIQNTECEAVYNENFIIMHYTGNIKYWRDI